MIYQRVIIVFALVIFLGKTGLATWIQDESDIYDKSTFVFLSYETSSNEWKEFTKSQKEVSLTSSQKLIDFMEKGEKAAFQTFLLQLEKKPEKKNGFDLLLFEIIKSKCKGAFYAADILGMINVRSNNIPGAFEWYNFAETLICKDEIIDPDYLFNYATTLICFKEDFNLGSEKALDKAWTLLKILEKQGVSKQEEDLFQTLSKGFFKSIKKLESPDLVVTLCACQQEDNEEIKRLENKNKELLSKNKTPIYLKQKKGMLSPQKTANIIKVSFYEIFNYTEVLHLMYQNYNISTVFIDSDNIPKDPFFSLDVLQNRHIKTMEKLTEVVRKNVISLIPSIKGMFIQESFKNVENSFEKAAFLKSSKNVRGLAHSLLSNSFTRKALLELKEPTEDIVLSKRLEWISNVDLWPILTKILLS